jgi:hypothetical protein
VPIRVTPSGSAGGINGTDTTGYQATVPRQLAVGAIIPASGTLHLTYFRATRSQPVGSLRTQTRGNAAAGLSLARMGLYEVTDEATGEGTLLASTASDTSLWTQTFSSNGRAVQQPGAAVQAGRLYGFGCLAIGTAMPSLYGCGSWVWDGDAPVTGRAKGNMSDLPATLPPPFSSWAFNILGAVHP